VGRARQACLGALLAAALALLAIAATAHGELSASGDLFVRFGGAISPNALPRDARAPISVSIAATVKTLSGERPPALRRIRVAINRGGRLDARGLPVCRRAQIQPSSSAEARAVCGGALVGEGSFDADVAFPEQPAFPSHGHVLAFNALIAGHPAILAHVYGTEPAPITRIVVFRIRRAAGTYGTVLSAAVPEGLNQWGYVTHFSLRLHRVFSYRGRRRSYLSAACAAPAGFPGASFPLARAAMSFADGRTLAATLTRSCKVKP
jgi:hypothetical protein